MAIKYAYVSNIMYDSTTIVPVRWWNKLLGFPGRIVITTQSVDAPRHTPETLILAKRLFKSRGFSERLLGERR